MKRILFAMPAVLLSTVSAQMTWTCVAESAGWSPRTDHASVVFDDKLWVMGGYPPYRDRLNDVWYSTDGVDWTRVDSAAAWRPRGWHTSMTFDDKVWVIGGDSTISSLAISDVWYSSGLGIEETKNDQRGTMNRGATVLSRWPTGAYVFDATGRRAANPKPGVYFVREKRSRSQGVEDSMVRKVVVTR